MIKKYIYIKTKNIGMSNKKLNTTKFNGLKSKVFTSISKKGNYSIPKKKTKVFFDGNFYFLKYVTEKLKYYII